MIYSRLFNRTIKISKVIILFICIIIGLLFSASIMVTMLGKVKSSFINHVYLNVSNSSMWDNFAVENIYFNPKTIIYVPIIENITSTISVIKVNDLRSFVGQEVLGFNNYYSDILVAGEGTDITNVPSESNVSMDEIKKGGNAVSTPSINSSSIPKKEVLLYYSHTRESFFSLLNISDNESDPLSTTTNISLLGNRLKSNLEKSGIGTVSDTTDVGNILLNRGLKYSDSYQVSREIVQNDKLKYSDLKYFIDIHRDSSGKQITTKEINGMKYAKICFIIGSENPHFEKNLAMAKVMNRYLDEHYLGVSRGIFQKGFNDGNGIYNQDVSPNAILIEIGGVDNTLDELNNAVDVLTEAFLFYYHQNN